MTLCVLGFFAAEARNSSIISPNSGDLLRYFVFHLAQSVPAGALLASSTNSISLFSGSVQLHSIVSRCKQCNLFFVIEQGM